jgi:hypothetical protein
LSGLKSFGVRAYNYVAHFFSLKAFWKHNELAELERLGDCRRD